MFKPKTLAERFFRLVPLSRSRGFWVPAAFAVILLALYALHPLLMRPVQASADLPIYTDALTGGWEDWSWDTTRDFNNPAPVYEGSASISVTYTAKWGGLYLHTNIPVPISGYAAIQFLVNGGAVGGQLVNFHLNNGLGNAYFTLQANTWLQVTVPLSMLGSPSTLDTLMWQDDSGGAQPIFYLDDIRLVGKPPFNGWLVLNGTDKHAVAGYQPELDLRGGSFTVEMWLKLSDAVLGMSDYQIIPIRQYSSFRIFTRKSYSVPPNPPRYCTQMLMYIADGTCWFIAPDTGTFLGTEWGHLAGVYDQATGKSTIYWNGQVLSVIDETQSPVTPQEFVINYGGDNLLGLVDEVRLSNTVRYSGPFTVPSSPFDCDEYTRALWHFDEPEGSTVFHDSCGVEDNALTGYNGAHTEGVSLPTLYLPLLKK
jgi:hypothetical protein